jgi:hypothetical protein
MVRIYVLLSFSLVIVIVICDCCVYDPLSTF